MSQHYFKTTTHNGKPACVTAGWDRPSQEFFMYITDSQEPDADSGPYARERFFYHHLEDRQSQNQKLAYFVQKAADSGITLPKSMIDEVNRDRTLNAGNRCCNHHTDGTFTDFGRSL